MNKILKVCLAFCLVACSLESKKGNSNEEARESSDKALVPTSWIDSRVFKAQQRLQSSSAGKTLLSSIDAHGGLTAWFSNGPISFHFDYQPLDGGKRRNSYQIVDS